ncbi:MAG TPA: hypothetical protein VK620_20970 [Bradyrhizobium sp.]|nr:hypothetical protein [Bradyrhizobium sp.]
MRPEIDCTSWKLLAESANPEITRQPIALLRVYNVGRQSIESFGAPNEDTPFGFVVRVLLIFVMLDHPAIIRIISKIAAPPVRRSHSHSPAHFLTGHFAGRAQYGRDLKDIFRTVPQVRIPLGPPASH